MAQWAERCATVSWKSPREAIASAYREVLDHGREVLLVLGELNFLWLEAGVIRAQEYEESRGVLQGLGVGEESLDQGQTGTRCVAREAPIHNVQAPETRQYDNTFVINAPRLGAGESNLYSTSTGESSAI